MRLADRSCFPRIEVVIAESIGSLKNADRYGWRKAKCLSQALSAKPDYVEAMANLAAVRRARGDKHGSSPRRGKRSCSDRNLRKRIQTSTTRSKIWAARCRACRLLESSLAQSRLCRSPY